SVSTRHSTPSFSFLYASPPHRDLHSFPTRRSSDLQLRRCGAAERWVPRSVSCSSPRPRGQSRNRPSAPSRRAWASGGDRPKRRQDRKSTRLNSSHRTISYAVFCLKKKKKTSH